MKTQNTKPIHLSSIYTKLFTAMLMFFAAAAVTCGLSVSTVHAEIWPHTAGLSVGQTITFKTSDYSKVTSSDSKIVKVTKKNGKYIATAMKAGKYLEDDAGKGYFESESATLKLYKKGKLKEEMDINVYNKCTRIYIGKSVNYKTSTYSGVTSADPKIVKVTKKNGKYVAVAKKEGTTVLKLYKKGKLAKTVPVVAAKKSSLKADTSMVTLKKGKEIDATEVADLFELKTGKLECDTDVCWSCNTSVAEWWSDGTLYMKKTGKATIKLALVSENGALIKTYKKTIKVK